MRRDPETREGERAEPQFLRPRPSFGERASERDGRRAPPLRHEEQRGAAGEREGEIISSDGRTEKRTNARSGARWNKFFRLNRVGESGRGSEGNADATFFLRTISARFM